MKKTEIMIKLKLIQKNCDTDIERDNYGNLRRETCILHKYFQSIGKERTTMTHCLGGSGPCSEMQRVFGMDTRMTRCPIIHKEIYNIIKDYKLPRSLRI